MSSSIPRLFVIAPPSIPADEAAACLRAAAAAGDVAALLAAADEDGGHDAARARLMVEAARELEIAAIIDGDIELARRCAADGVQLADAGEIARARKALGGEAIIGARASRGRDEAMRLGEAGADYIMIDQRQQAGGENLLSWWAEMFVVPVVAAHPAEEADAAALAAAGADFVCPTPAMWESPDRAAEIAAALTTALREAAE